GANSRGRGGGAGGGRGPAAIQGRQASARPRDLPCSAIARPPDARATSHRAILHNAADLDTALRGCPQRLRSMERSAMSKPPGIFTRPSVTAKGNFGG